MISLLDDDGESGAFVLPDEMRPHGNSGLAGKSTEYSLGGRFYSGVGCACSGKRHGKSCIDGQRSGVQIYARWPRHERREIFIHTRCPCEGDSSKGDDKKPKTVWSFQVFLA
jgi:hypothetical protein